MGVSPAIFQKLEKTALIFGEKHPDCSRLWILFLHEILLKRFKSFLEKNWNFFPAGPFFLVLYMKYLSKCPNSKKNPRLWKFPGCAPEKITNFWKLECKTIFYRKTFLKRTRFRFDFYKTWTESQTMNKT